MVLLAEDGFWDGAHALLDRATAGGVIKDKNRAIMQGASTIDEALAILRTDRSHELPEFVTGELNDSA